MYQTARQVLYTADLYAKMDLSIADTTSNAVSYSRQ